MRLLPLLLLVLAPAAAAAEEPELRYMPARTLTPAFVGHTSKLSGLTESGMGVGLEAALGHRRWQYFAEASYEWVTVGPEGAVVEGKQVRGGIGARWLARSFELGNAGTFDLTLEASVGVQRFHWDGDVAGPIRRPDFGFGWGLQDRLFIGKHQVGIRMAARVTFAPVERDAVTAVCRGTCTMPASSSNSGISVVMAALW